MIHDAIMALGPMLYWPLNDAVGSTTVLDASGNGHTGTVNGEVTLGVYGPEWGQTCVRIFTGGDIQSNGLGLAAWNSFSFNAFLSAPADGSAPSQVGWAVIRDAALAINRGIATTMQSTGIATLRWGWGGSGTPMTALMSWPQSSWHLITHQFDASIGQMQLWFDGSMVASSSATPGTVWVASDVLTLYSQAPMVISHAAFFTKTLTSSQITDVAHQINQWPWQIPVNTMPVASGTVDLSPVLTQTTQILNNQATTDPIITTDIPAIKTSTDIIEPIVVNTQPTINSTHTDTQNIVNTLFPQLSDFLNTIMNGITSTLTGVGGAVTKTIGDIFSGKTWDALTEYDFGSACQPDVLDVNLGGGTFFGITVHCTTYADWYVWTGPGDSYATQSLGTLEIIRGGNTVLRHGLHTKSYEVYPLPAVPFFEIEISTPVAPGDYRVVVTPAPETCWSLKGLYLP